MNIESYFRPHRSSARIRELEGPPLKELGGTFWVYLYNPSRNPLVVSTLLVHDLPAEARINGRGLNWFRLIPEPLPPRRTALLVLNVQASLLREAPLKLEIISREGKRYSATLPAVSSPLTLAHAWIEGRTLKVIVRNEDSAHAWQIERLRVEGRSLRFRSTTPKLAPGQLTFLTATLPTAPPPYAMLPLQVDARTSNRTTMTGGLVRPIEPFFPLGTWRTAVWENPQDLQAWHQNGFDTFVFSAENDPTATEKRAFEELCPQLGVKALVFAGFPRPATRFIERHAQNPHIIAYMIKDEPDWADPQQYGMWMPTLCERVAQVFRDRKITPPVYLNLARSRRFGEFATIPDIACYDAYRVGAPMPDLAPEPWGNWLELAGNYTEDLRANCEPLPFWVWAQGAHTWDERVWVEGQLGRACPTPEEIRVQLWFQLSRGAKGVLWFTGFDEPTFRNYYTQAEDIPALKRLPESERAPLVEQLVAHGREAFQEQARLNRFLKAIRTDLLRMDWLPNAVRVLRATNPQKLDANALVGEQKMAIWLTNYDYTLHPQGYQFKPQGAIEIAVTLPAWLKPRRARFLSPSEDYPVTFERRGADTLIVQIAQLPEHVGTLWLEER